MAHVVKLSMVDDHNYDVLLNGVKVSEIYYNMTGFRGSIPTHRGTQFSAGECGISTWKKCVAMINREAREADIEAANLQDRRLENGLKFSAQILEMLDGIKADQDEFLSNKGMTFEEARELPPAERDALNEDYKAWLQERDEANLSPRM